MNTINIKAIAILALVVFLVYFPISLLNHTLETSLNRARLPVFDFQRDYGCSANCIGPINWTIDPGADGDSIGPNAKLISTLYSEGIIPLWNPYLAAGTPLAAETINFAFSPMIIFYTLPNFVWDIPLLIYVWISGVFTYFLLRSWNLNFNSSICGSTIFMLSGAITWYLPHDSILVVIFTPLILFSIEKILQVKNFKYVVLGSVAVTLSILGGHLESIILLLLLCLSYAVFRISYMIFSNYNNRQNSNNRQDIVILQSKKRIILKVALIFFAGLGLSAFFVLPVGEYILSAGLVGRDASVGLAASPSFTIATTFIPYLLGPIHTYANPATGFMASWNVLGGYVIASSLLFSIIGITFSDKLFQSSLNKRIAQFFFGIAIFFMLKSIGIPIINLIGTIPIFDHVIFPRYDGFIFTLGLAISAAFGIEIIQNQKIKLKHLSIVLLTTFSIIITSASLIVPYFTKIDLAAYYTIFQVLQSLFFILVAFLLILAYYKKKCSGIVFFFLFFLEASLYISFGLTPLWQFYRSILVILGVTALCSVSFLPLNKIKLYDQNKIKLILFVIISGLSMIGQVIVYVESPQGLPIRHDAFQSTSLTNFLNDNLKNSRIFSYDSMFVPNHPEVYQIQTLAIASAQQVAWFNSFVINVLDPYAISTNFDYIPSWRTTNSTPIETTFLLNQKYYNFLGVKYIVASSTNPNSLQTFTLDGWAVIGSTNNVITQTFTTKSDDITSISVQLGTYNRINHGDIVLTMDSIPYDENFHRVSKIKAEDVLNGQFNYFPFDILEHTKNKKFSVTLSHPQAILETNAVAIAVHNNSSSVNSFVKLEQLFVDGKPISNLMNVIPYSSEDFPLVFTFDNLKVYENKDAFPRVFLVNKYITTNSYENAQQLIKDPNFDLRHEIVLEKNPTTEQASLINSSSMDEYPSAKIESYSANKVMINTTSKSASLLVLTDTYYPGWKAHVDGKESNIYRADGLVRAVFVPEGSHTVEFSYVPTSFVIGIMISFVTVGILLGLVIYLKKRKNELYLSSSTE